MITHECNLNMHACYTATVISIVKVHMKMVALMAPEDTD